MDWQPRLADGGTPVYARLVEAIERDIDSGALAAGTRLPPHRDLAHRLGLSVGTVSRAYAEAERRGLIAAHVGRGSFVTGSTDFGPAGPTDGIVDLARNLSPAGPGARRLPEALAWLRSSPDLAAAACYGPPEGLLRIRAAAAQWLQRRHGLESAQADGIIQCNGGQHGLALALGAICRPGDVILCEVGTFYGLRILADHAAYRLHGVAMDQKGLEPEALERAIATTGARVLYTMPTLQNPTSRTMDEERRRAVAEIARRHDLWIVEDDAYRLYADGAPRLASFMELAPERTFHIASISKGICAGLRLGFLLGPDAPPRERVLRGVRATGYCPPPLGGLIFAQWVADGTANMIVDEVMAEVERRTQLALRIFGSAAETPGAPRSLHIWLPMSPLEAERAAGRALRAGVEVTPPEAPILAPPDISGLRICLGAAPDIATLGWALEIVRAATQGEVCERSRATI